MTDAPNTKLNQRVAIRPWRLWMTQIWTIVRLDIKRNLFSWRSLWIYFLVFAPTVIIALHALIDRHRHSMSDDTTVLAAIFQFYYLRLGIFFGTLGIFTRLIRGEMIERTLHYYMLAPIRREVLLVGKYIAGALRAVILFGAAAYINFMLMYMHFGTAGERYISDGPGRAELLAYLTVTVLACLGYGALFLLFSILLKNPTPAALVLMGWEGISLILPATLQKLSIIAYLRPLMPVPVPAEGIFALLTVQTEPVPSWLAVAGVIVLTASVLVLSCYRIRRLEISYTTE
jgi:ABC-type transport system involved in multi-copper enzyme maturation permease subunit